MSKRKSDIKSEKKVQELSLKNHLKKSNILSESIKDDKKIKYDQLSGTSSKKIPVDKECKIKINDATIFTDGNDIYDVMLNQTNLQFNNNKFYIIQLLKDKGNDNYSIWMRWARVGKIGQTKLIPFNSDLSGAKKCFSKKFFEKTRNNWSERSNFKKIDGKYDLVHIDYNTAERVPPSTSGSVKKIKLELLECQLNSNLQELLKMIFNIEDMNSTASDLHYDTGKLPLGRLTEVQIKAGYKALREIEGLLTEGCQGDQRLITACNAYYTRIPHDFGMKTPPIIRSMPDIKRELELLEALSDMKIALNLLEMGDINVHPLERQYQSLDCDIKLLSDQDPIYKLLNDYLIKTHGSTHSNYSLEMLDLYEVRKENQWNDYKNHGNNMLLWHGSRTTNYGGILSQGLRIAPPEAPATGHMFGKGVYFADVSSKAANYIYASPRKNIGLMLLCEVSLGNAHKLTKADSKASKLPENCQSVIGCGMIEPCSTSWVTMSDGVIVPVGEPRDTGLSQKHKGYLLNYNEYIVYNPNQIKMRYLVKVQFNYK